MNIFKDKNDKNGWNSLSNAQCSQNDLHDIDELVWNNAFIVNDIGKGTTIKYSTYPAAPIRYNIMKGTEGALNVYSDYYSLSEAEKQFIFENQSTFKQSLVSNIFSFKRIVDGRVISFNKEILSDAQNVLNSIDIEGIIIFNMIEDLELLTKLLEIVKSSKISFFFITINEKIFNKKARVYVSRLMKRSDVIALKVDVVNTYSQSTVQSYILDLGKLNEPVNEGKKKASITARIASKNDEDLF